MSGRLKKHGLKMYGFVCSDNQPIHKNATHTKTFVSPLDCLVPHLLSISGRVHARDLRKWLTIYRQQDWRTGFSSRLETSLSISVHAWFSVSALRILIAWHSLHILLALSVFSASAQSAQKKLCSFPADFQEWWSERLLRIDITPTMPLCQQTMKK